MVRIHIVGAKHSFTYDASKLRYKENDNNKHEFIPKSHKKLVEALLKKEIPIVDSAVVPLWNSNTGTVDMDRKTRTEDLLLGKAGNIFDLWPQQISFKLHVKNGSLNDKSRIFSVKVATNQCSSFLNKHNVLTTNRFEGKDSTTEAAKAFLEEAQPCDGLLCSEYLLKANTLDISNEEVTNPYNYTLFSTFNKLPTPFGGNPQVSLGCIVVDLNGNELPTKFINYYKYLIDMKEIQESKDILLSMPKILFILRYIESKALMLLEIDAGSFKESPWPPADIDVEESELEGKLDLIGQVGRVYELFSQNVTHLFINNFKCSAKCTFYGYEDSYVWACPALNVCVHGYDKELVRTCAKVQVLHLKSLLGAGIEFPKTAVSVLKCFGKDPASLKLSADSEPEGP